MRQLQEWRDYLDYLNRYACVELIYNQEKTQVASPRDFSKTGSDRYVCSNYSKQHKNPLIIPELWKNQRVRPF